MRRGEIPPGTLELLILKTLERSRELHGFEIARSIGQLSNEVLNVEEGSLYPALQRLLIKGWIKASWSATEENRRARYYRLTPSGTKQLAVELRHFHHVFGAVLRVLEVS
jgi:PadR family transcriptional regulator, regulatory protein PadR